jgi:multiple antibiotic resistance protein
MPVETTAFLILSFSSLFAVIDPLGVIPFFTGLTATMSARQKGRVLVKALITAFLVLVVFTLAGQQLLRMFGITIEAFRIAGGVIFFGIGLDMLQSKPRRWQTGIRRAAAEDKESHAVQHASRPRPEEDPSITPLAIPMIAGPGSITTVMVLTPQAPAQIGVPLVLLVVAAILLLTGGILMGADAVLKRLGATGMRIIEKLMGLLVTVIAVQFLIDGVSPVIRGLI